MAFIEARGLSRELNGRPFLQALDFEVSGGEILGLVGPAAAGKTTLLRLLSTESRPSSGTLQIAGLDAVERAADVRHLLAVVDADDGLLGELTLEENLSYAGRWYGLDEPTRRQRIQEVLAAAGLSDRRQKPLADLGRDARAVAAVAAAFLHRPRLVLVDEPATADRWPVIQRLLAGLREPATTVVIASRRPEPAERLCDRLGLLDGGRLIACGTRDELLAMVAGKQRLAIETRQELVAEIVDPIVDGETYVLEPHRLELLVDDPGERLADVAGRLHGAGFRVKTIEVREPDLESVFLELAGRRLTG